MGRKRSRSPSQGQGLTFGAGALIALERGDGKIRALLAAALNARASIRIPAGVVGQVWRDGRRQTKLARLLAVESVEVVPLSEAMSRAAGELCGAAGTTDVVDASIVLVARARQDPIVTSDPKDLRRLAPTAPIHAI